LDVKKVKREIREKRHRREIRLEILYGLDEKKSGKREINKNLKIINLPFFYKKIN
jgi:hypothetical protein